MMQAISIQTLALVGVVISGLVFFLYARKTISHQTTLDGYLLADKTVTGSEFANTFAVANVSLAGNLTFFVGAHRDYGYLMALGPLMFVALQWLVLSFVNKAPSYFSNIRSIADIWSNAFPGKTMARLIAVLCAWCCMMTVFVEILVGAEILSVFLPAGALYKAGTFLLLAMVVLSYVCYGGYKAIIKTDNWQLVLIFLATAAMVLFSVYSPTLNESTAFEITSKLLSYGESGWGLTCFITWACILNVFLAVTDISLWQRIAASTSPNQALKGFVHGLWKWVVVFVVPMMCFVVLYLKGNHYNTMPEFLNLVLTQSGALGHIIFPLIVVGFISALFSTADTMMIAAMYSVCDRHTFLPKLERIPPKQREKTLKKYLSLFTVLLSALLAFLYYLNHSEFGGLIIPLMYAAWGLICVTAPLIMTALYRLVKGAPAQKFSKAQNAIVITGLAISWVMVLVSSYTGIDFYEQLSLLVGAGIVYVSLVLAINLIRVQELINIKPSRLNVTVLNEPLELKGK